MYFNAANVPLKVVIMLGPDYDFSEPPFMDASGVLEYFNQLQNTGWFSPPTFDTVVVDVETPIPVEHHVTVIAVIPPELDEEERQKFTKKIQLNAVRFGITHVETVSKEPSDDESNYPEKIWLRIPFTDTQEMQRRAANYARIAVALADAIDDDRTQQPRLDIYQVPQAKRQNSSAPRDPFAGGGDIRDPFAGGGDPFGDGKPSQLTEEAVQYQREKTRKLIEQLQRKSEAAIKSTASIDQIRKVLPRYVAADYELRMKLQKLELFVLQTKLDKLREAILERESESVKQAIIDQRVQAMLDGRDQ